MTILPIKRQNSGNTEGTDENSQPNQQTQAGVNISVTRTNHNDKTLGHELVKHHEISSSDRILRSATNSSNKIEEILPSSKRRSANFANINTKERYKKIERKRAREKEVGHNLESPASPEQDSDAKNEPNDIEDKTGYNSEDEYNEHPKEQLTAEEWRQRDKTFARSLEKRGFIIKPMVEDGACLFRAIADQVYGDQEMNSLVRSNCMDYILQNRDFYSAYITEDFDKYVCRKRLNFVHGNHLEIHALSEMYNRSIEVYSYQLTPINIFHGTEKSDYEPIRLSYQRGSHYNSITNPRKSTVGVGLGLPDCILPSELDNRQVKDAVQKSEEMLIEQAMMEDKLKATDWEATNEVIEEQVARESYIQWCKDQEKRRKKSSSPTGSSSTITSACCSSSSVKSPKYRCRSPYTLSSSPKENSRSPKSQSLKKSPVKSPNSPKNSLKISPINSPMPLEGSSAASNTKDTSSGSDEDFVFVPLPNETESIFSRLPPEVFGLREFEDADIMARVLAESQQEYLDSLKASRNQNNPDSSY